MATQTRTPRDDVLRDHVVAVTAALVLNCGTGDETAELIGACRPRAVVALDPDPDAIAEARRRYEHLPAAYFVAGDFLAPGLWHNAVNLVLVLGEIPEPLRENIMAGPLRLGGHLVVVHVPYEGIRADLDRMRMTAGGFELVEQVAHEGRAISVYRTD